MYFRTSENVYKNLFTKVFANSTLLKGNTNYLANIPRANFKALGVPGERGLRSARSVQQFSVSRTEFIDCYRLGHAKGKKKKEQKNGLTCVRHCSQLRDKSQGWDQNQDQD